MTSDIYHITRLSRTEQWLNGLIAQAWSERDDNRMRQMKKLRLLVKDAMAVLERRIVAADSGAVRTSGEDAQDAFVRRGLM